MSCNYVVPVKTDECSVQFIQLDHYVTQWVDIIGKHYIKLLRPILMTYSSYCKLLRAKVHIMSWYIVFLNAAKTARPLSSYQTICPLILDASNGTKRDS